MNRHVANMEKGFFSMSQAKMEDIISLCKRRGFIYQGSDVYGGLSGTWDYGPLGVQLKRNIMNLWWRMFVDERDDIYGVDAAILMNPKVWKASGHVDTFVDPLCEDTVNHRRYRTDHILKDNGIDLNKDIRNFTRAANGNGAHTKEAAKHVYEQLTSSTNVEETLKIIAEKMNNNQFTE